MTNISEEVKELYNEDIGNKQIILEFYKNDNDLTPSYVLGNENIISESMELNEGLSTERDIRFGQCYSSKFSIDIFGLKDKFGDDPDFINYKLKAYIYFSSNDWLYPDGKLLPENNLYPENSLYPESILNYEDALYPDDNLYPYGYNQSETEIPLFVGYVDSSVLANILNLKPVKEGCRFVKWKTEVNNTTTPATTIYTAVWEEVGFTISYDLAGGEWEDGFTPVTEFERDQVVTLPTPVKAEHTFLGWYQGDVKVEAIGNSNYELVAKWQVNEYIITYQFDGGDWATSGISDHAGFVEAFLVDYEAYIKGLGWTGEAISRTEDPAHAADFMGVSYGYAAATEAFFKTDATYSAKWGWILTFLTSKGANLSSTTLIRSNVHALLHLTKWEKWPYSVDLSGVQFEEYSSNLPTGTKQEGPTKYVAGAEIVLPALVKEGKVFKGWSLSADLSNPFTTLPVGTTGNIVLFAVFE